MASGGSEDGDLGLQIAPMVDVVFVLMLFFMASAGSQQKEKELGIALPGKGKPAHADVIETPIYLKLEDSGQVLFNELPVDGTKTKELNELRGRLTDIISKFGEKQPVIIVPSPNTRHERLIDVLNTCTAAGVKSLSFGS
ncbi:MAG: biopolymer transporter ExbD [Verrucomicrobiota bacterium]|nr:biopolymer transporter ExbD [Verrucomicrobiota bacterium]